MLLTGKAESVYAPDDVRAIEVSGNAALYKGDHKITRSMPPVGDGRWRLFNMREDPGETVDLSDSQPDVLAHLLKAYDQYAADMGVLAMPAGYDSMQQISRNSMERLEDRYGWAIVMLGVVLLGGLYGVWRGVGALWRRRAT